jgi:MFS family permease
MSPYITLIKTNSDFTKLWLSEAVSQLGDWFNVIVLLALVSEYTDGSGLAVSLFLLARIVPPLLITPYAGVLADKLNRKTIMIVTDILRAIIVLMFLLSTGAGTLWLIYVLTVAQFSLTAIFLPSKSAILPNLVKREDIITANTIGSITWSAMLAIGAMAGGIVAGVLGITVALVIDALTYLVSAVLIVRIENYEKPIADTHTVKAECNPSQIMEGLRYAIAHPQVAISLIVKAGGVVGSTETIMTIFATQIFVTMNSGGETSLGLMYGATGIGAVLGPILLNYFHDGSNEQMRKVILWGFVLLTLGWAIVGQASALWIVALGLGVRAMGGSANWTYSSAMIQQTTDDHYLGRMFSLETTLMHTVGILSTVGTGALIDILGVSQVHIVTWIIAGLSLVPLVIWWLVTQYTEKQSTVLATSY